MFYSATIKFVSLSLVTRRTKEPFFGRSFPSVHFANVLKQYKEIIFFYSNIKCFLNQSYSAIKFNGVQVEKSAFGIHLRFIGVSRVIGKMETTNEFSGKPELGAANDFVS